MQPLSINIFPRVMERFSDLKLINISLVFKSITMIRLTNLILKLIPKYKYWHSYLLFNLMALLYFVITSQISHFVSPYFINSKRLKNILNLRSKYRSNMCLFSFSHPRYRFLYKITHINFN